MWCTRPQGEHPKKDKPGEGLELQGLWSRCQTAERPAGSVSPQLLWSCWADCRPPWAMQVKDQVRSNQWVRATCALEDTEGVPGEGAPWGACRVSPPGAPGFLRWGGWGRVIARPRRQGCSGVIVPQLGPAHRTFPPHLWCPPPTCTWNWRNLFPLRCPSSTLYWESRTWCSGSVETSSGRHGTYTEGRLGAERQEMDAWQQFYSARGRTAALVLLTAQMKCRNVMLRERRLSQRNTYCRSPFT